MGTGSKIAVVLFNLGGPDRPEAVQPFLFNLFCDPAIISVPQPFRWLIAKLVSTRRAPVAREIYANLGGGSPILGNTQAQADALETEMAARFPEADVRCFIAMRYWHPFAGETAQMVQDWGADEIVLLPLYPQYSTTTTGSSVKDWARASAKTSLAARVHRVCCYPTQEGFVGAHVVLLRQALAKIGEDQPVRVLFSAHGLPKRVIERGDPYQRQVAQSIAAIVSALGVEDLDWVSCFQSRVGPLEWIGPSTEDEIARAGADGKVLVVVPIAFVSEHSETLVELDVEYRALAEAAGVPAYHRVATLDCQPAFIAGLADLAVAALGQEADLCPGDAAGSPCLEA